MACGNYWGESRACIGLSSLIDFLLWSRYVGASPAGQILAKCCESIDLSQRVKPFYENTALFVPGTPGCKGTSSQRLGACPAPRESEVEFHLTSPGISFRLPPRGATAHRGFPGFNARPMAGQKVHSHTADHRPAGCRPAAPERPSRSLPLGRSWRDLWIGFGSSPRSGCGPDEVRIWLSRC